MKSFALRLIGSPTSYLSNSLISTRIFGFIAYCVKAITASAPSLKNVVVSLILILCTGFTLLYLLPYTPRNVMISQQLEAEKFDLSLDPSHLKGPGIKQDLFPQFVSQHPCGAIGDSPFYWQHTVQPLHFPENGHTR